MKKLFKMKIVFLAVFLFMLLVPVFASAQGIVQCGKTPEDPCTLCDFFLLFKNVIDFLILPTASNGHIPLVFIIAVFMIIVGGLRYMFAYMGDGGPGEIKAANRIFLSVAVGLLIIYGSWIIVNTLLTFSGLLKPEFSGWSPAEWYKLDCGSSSPSTP